MKNYSLNLLHHCSFKCKMSTKIFWVQSAFKIEGSQVDVVALKKLGGTRGSQWEVPRSYYPGLHQSVPEPGAYSCHMSGHCSLWSAHSKRQTFLQHGGNDVYLVAAAVFRYLHPLGQKLRQQGDKQIKIESGIDLSHGNNNGCQGDCQTCSF